MFSRGEIRWIGATLALFLAGLGWRSAQARLSPTPLEVSGTPLEWKTAPAEETDSTGSVGIGTHARAARSAKPPKLAGTAAIDPNTASVAQLQSLPGIGAALAQRIADARSESRFADADDLLRVKGIGAAKLDKIRPHLTFSGTR